NSHQDQSVANVNDFYASCRPAGAPLAGELRCRCPRAVSQVIPPRLLARVELVAEGATTKQGQTICLSPSAPWVKLILTRILKRDLEKRDVFNRVKRKSIIRDSFFALANLKGLARSNQIVLD
uniref:Chemokine interleukin-8-like domain-containing protein n=1 Tax=Calidris pygmaea TaxID=425635 RepID=A0A8C3PHU0_9CHAR